MRAWELTEFKMYDTNMGKIFENPSSSDIKGLLNTHGILRGIFSNNTAWVWNAYNTSHNFMRDELINIGFDIERFENGRFDFIIANKSQIDAMSEWDNMREISNGVWSQTYGEDLSYAMKKKTFSRMFPKSIDEGEKADLPDIEVGDELRTGKFKNRKVIVKGFKKDKNNHPVAKTTKGDVPLLKPRVTKLMPNKIDESFDKPYTYTWSDQTKGAWRGRFRTISNDYVDVNIENFRERWRIEFTRNDDFNVTGGGDAMRIFATVIIMIDEFISIESPLVVKFSADKSKLGSDSRSKLYTRMVNRFANNVDYSVTTTTEDNKVFYTLSMKDNLTEGSHQDDAEAYAAQHGMEVSWEGSGDMGEAYITDKDTIIKVTTDKTEMAMALKLVGQKLSNVANIYDVQGHIIHMERLEVSGAEDVYNDVSQYDNGDGIEYIDPDDHPNMSEEAIKMVQDLNYGIYELGKNGIQNLDIKGDNLGQKPNGDYAFFDMSDAKRGMW